LQIKVQEELDNIFGNDKERPVTSTDLSNMAYLTLCVKEALRIYPIVPFNFRKLSEDIKYGILTNSH
jgi:cytochrome P450